MIFSHDYGCHFHHGKPPFNYFRSISTSFQVEQRDIYGNEGGGRGDLAIWVVKLTDLGAPPRVEKRCGEWEKDFFFTSF